MTLSGSNKPPDPSRFAFMKPVLMVLLIAALLVFIKVLPDLPGIAETTEEYREDTHALVTAPPLPPSDTTTVGLTDPGMFEPGPTVEPGENVTPSELEPSGRAKTLAGIVDALIYVFIAVLGGFGIYLLFKYRKRMTLKYMFGSSVMMVVIATTFFFGFMVYRMVDYKLDPDMNEVQLILTLMVVSVPVGIFISYSMFSRNAPIRKRNFALLMAGALMGSFLAALLPIYGVIPLVIAISLFDIYSVRRGPIRKIMTLEDERIREGKPKPVKAEPAAVTGPAGTAGRNTGSDTARSAAAAPQVPKKMVNSAEEQDRDDDSDLMLLYEGRDWSIGIGDFVIYSMFAAFVLTHTLQFMPYYGFYTPVVGFVLPWFVFILTVAGLLAGYTFTLKLLSRRELLPGLPLAIAFGLVLFLGSLAVMELANFLFYGKLAPIV